MTTPFNWTPGQDKGLEKFNSFYLDPNQTVMVLKGYSGTGKTTLVKRFLTELPQLNAMAKLCALDYIPLEVVLSATTNQAAEAFALAVGPEYEVRTVYSVCQLRIVEDFKTREKRLVEYGDGLDRSLLVVDEASFLNQEALGKILQQARTCKIVFIGDPAQITPVDSDEMPAFELNACEIELTELVRFEGGVLQTLMGNLRTAVTEGNWAKFPLVPGVIERMSQEDFNAEAYRLFTQETDKQVKILAYTNATVTAYNNHLSKRVLGSVEPQVGQRMLVNQAVQNAGSKCATNEEVTIEEVTLEREYGTDGYQLRFRNKGSYYYMPKRRGAKDTAHAVAVDKDDYSAMKNILTTWVDLRPSFAQTINKSQGSTYDIVMIDLNDLCSKCRTLDQLARLLYVGLSRARSRIILTGDLRRK